MALSTAEKAEIVEKFATKKGDTASPQVQVALLTKRLAQLNDHFKVNKKDHHSRRGLLKIVGRRKRLLSYLKGKDAAAYKTLIGELGLRK
jgi:small subunit ribosomal protein S15